MKTKTSIWGDRSGMTLFVVMMMTLLCSAAVASVLFSVGTRVQQAYRQVHMEQAFYVAEAGMERAAAYVAATNETDTTLTGSLGDGSYEATVTCTPLSGGEIGIEVESIGTVDHVSRSVTVRGLRNVSWARYALWYDREVSALVIGAGEKFNGRVYSRPLMRFDNKNISSNGKVHFYDKVWTVPDHIQYDSGAYPIFDNGLVTSADVQSMASVNFADLKTAATSGNPVGLLLDGDATVVLQGTTMKVTNGPRGWTNKVVTIPNGGLVYARACTYTNITYDSKGKVKSKTVKTESGDITVSGPTGMDGQMTMVSENDINIVNHVKYASDPATNPNSDDKLGLIAQRNVVVTTAAPNNMEIYAHIFCKTGGFGVDQYGSGNFRGTLKVYGGIANLQRNAVGTTTPTGYLKNYIYDTRFARNPPPYYPRLTDELEWTGWEG